MTDESSDPITEDQPDSDPGTATPDVDEPEDDPEADHEPTEEA